MGLAPGKDLAACCDDWAALPLVFQPGSEWNYGVSTDVLGRVVEIVSGQALDVFFRERIFDPLGMNETRFFVPEDDQQRLAALYFPQPGTLQAVRLDALAPVPAATRRSCRGGGGLVGTAGDYHRFTQMLVGGGELDGIRLLGTRTLKYMTRNHLPNGEDLEEFGRPLFAETTFDGVGFGLGFSVVDDAREDEGALDAGRLRLGRRSEHRVLGRPRGADHRPVHDAAPAVEHASDPAPAQATRVPGARRLKVTLTFDNGPWQGVTEDVLDTLAARQVQSTFFVVGRELARPGGRDLAARAVAEGHWIGNHTMTHSVPFGDGGDPVAEVESTQDLIGDLAHPARWFRPFGRAVGVLDERLLSSDAVAHPVRMRLQLRAVEQRAA